MANTKLAELQNILRFSPLLGLEKIEDPEYKHHKPKLTKQKVARVIKNIWNFLRDILSVKFADDGIVERK